MDTLKKSIDILLVGILIFIIESALFAQDTDHSDRLKIRSTPEVDSLMNSHDFVKAEKIARESNLDRRVIATIMAHAGKKDEAFAMFCEVIKSTPETEKKALTFQCINLLNSVSPNMGKDFFDIIVKKDLSSLSQKQMQCAEVLLLAKSGNLEKAKDLFNQLLESDYKDPELIPTMMTLIAYLNNDIKNQQLINHYIEKVKSRFPDDLRLKLQSIDMLSMKNPAKALSDLEELQRNHPEFYSKMKNFILLIKGRCMEQLGETNRAKSIYSELKGTDFESIGLEKIAEYEARDKIQKDLQEKIAQSNKSPYEFVEPDSTRFRTVLICINVFSVFVFLYLFYRYRK